MLRFRRLRYQLPMAFALLLLSGTSQAQIFGPLEYLQATDLPDGFCEECQLEDFEDNVIDPFLSFDCGEILGPNISDPRIPDVLITDSVDGDDGEIDGSGNAGHSYFCVDPARSISISFATPVAAAGAVWTDGDRGVFVQIEAFDANQASLGKSELAQIADDSYFGETAEDRFLGIRSSEGISSITISNVGRGAGIEIDHVRWDSKALPMDPTESPSIDEVCSAITASPNDLRFDLNGDENVSIDDITFFLNEVGTVAGDLDLDGNVSFSDFLAFAENFNAEGVSYTGGDFDCSGKVEFADFLTLARSFGAQAEAATTTSVPEPSGHRIFLFLIVSSALLRQRIVCSRRNH